MTNSQPSGRDLLAPEHRSVEGSKPGVIFLFCFAAFVTAGLGVLFLSQATIGVGLIAVGCFLAIIGRIIQAGAQHTAVMRALKPPQT